MPIFRGYCFTCHQPGGQGSDKSGLDLSTYEGVMRGTKFGKMVIPGNPDSSNLMWLLDWKGAPETHMPLGKKKLSVCERNTSAPGSARAPRTIERYCGRSGRLAEVNQK